MLAIPALLGEHVTGPYEGQLKPPLEVVVVTKGKAGYIHIDPVCQPQEPETCEDGDCMGKSRPEGTADLSVPADLYMLFCHK